MQTDTLISTYRIAGINMEKKILTSLLSIAIESHRVSKGYFWASEKDDWVKENIDQLKNIYQKYETAQIKKIKQIDKNGDIINTYNSVTEASKALGIKSVGNISRAISNNTICHNYYWKYA